MFLLSAAPFFLAGLILICIAAVRSWINYMDPAPDESVDPGNIALVLAAAVFIGLPFFI